MRKTLHYLFDPLCGWCYGASAAVAAVARADGVQLHLMPTGLFAGDGARTMNRGFAEYAWANDQRIQHLTGQPFSETYRQTVLTDDTQGFDSGPATLALSAVAQTAPEQEVAALHAIQHARYVDGQNITAQATLVNVLQGLGLVAAADLLHAPTAGLWNAHHHRIGQARSLMAALGARGVPTFVLEVQGQQRLLDARTAYTHPQQFAQSIESIRA